MAIFTLTSAAGSPGTTTTALGLALAWPSEVILLEADPVGGSAILAGYFRGELEQPATLMRLWAEHRQGRLAQALREAPLELTETVSYIPGPAGAMNAAGLGDLWPALAVHLRHVSDLGVDVVIDLGRWGHASMPAALVNASDELLVCMRSDLVSAAAVAAMDLPEATAASAVVIGPGQPYNTKSLTAVVGIPIRHDLPFSVDEAAVLSAGKQPRKGFKSTRKLATALEQMASSLLWQREQLQEGADDE